MYFVTNKLYFVLMSQRLGCKRSKQLFVHVNQQGDERGPIGKVWLK
jgi:hypothetical protein